MDTSEAMAHLPATHTAKHAVVRLQTICSEGCNMTEGNQYDRIKPVETGHRVDAQCGQIVLDTLSTERMRKLRLHHWENTLRFRSMQEREEYAASGCKIDSLARDFTERANRYKKSANFHLGAVQLLNQFFPIGDYADHGVKTG
jgi:hypothetical protein